MENETQRQDTRKAMAFDLCNIIDENPAQETYTKEEVKKLIKVYISTAEQKWGWAEKSAHLSKEVSTIAESKETPQERYHKAHTKIFSIRLVETTEQDIIQKLNSMPNKAGYIKRLIREDIAQGVGK